MMAGLAMNISDCAAELAKDPRVKEAYLGASEAK